MPSPCQAQYPTTQAPSTGQSSTHCIGGGVVVAPCVSRPSSRSSPCFSACRPFVDSTGAIPSRQPLRHVSIAVLLVAGDAGVVRPPLPPPGRPPAGPPTP